MNMSSIKCIAPMNKDTILSLRAGDTVLLSGVVYTARDAAHARLCAALERGEPLPADMRGQLIFYAGPTPTPPGKKCGAIGPTTSVRMDPYTPALLRYGIAGTIGKGGRGKEVADAVRECGAVYFTAPGGCAALLSSCVEKVEVIAYEDLGTESLKRLTVRDFPLTVAIDPLGGDAFRDGMNKYKQSAE